jgi:cytoskeletal protein CcmA (bactofilin family)
MGKACGKSRIFDPFFLTQETHKKVNRYGVQEEGSSQDFLANGDPQGHAIKGDGELHIDGRVDGNILCKSLT